MRSQESKAPKSRIEFVMERSSVSAPFLARGLSWADFKQFADHCEDRVRQASRDMVEHLKGDEDAVTSHAAHMRSVGAQMVLLRDGIVPAMEIDRDDNRLKQMAGDAMAFIQAELEAMELFLV